MYESWKLHNESECKFGEEFEYDYLDILKIHLGSKMLKFWNVEAKCKCWYFECWETRCNVAMLKGWETNCNVEMFGNPIIRNGNFIYLEPRSLGVPSELPKSLKGEVPSYEWAAYIGLAGYYLVVKTTHKITRQGYTTSVYGQPDYVQIGYEQPVLGNKKPSQNNMKKDISSK